MKKIFIILARRGNNGIWFFSDEGRGIHSEPFMGKINKLLDRLIVGSRAYIFFSRKTFSKAHVELRRTRREADGTWYQVFDHGVELGSGWLCGVLKRYFYFRPRKIYVQIQELA